VSLILVGGGARSGKSRYSLDRARQSGNKLAFVATAGAGDDEMRDRIGLHRQDRGPEFTTFEEPLRVADVIAEEALRFDAMVVDCLTLWLSNLLFADGADVSSIEGRGRELVECAAAASSPVILVTNEVGCGIVPDNALARQFRDLAGRLNQQAAQAAAEVHWMVFGIPLRVK
jgi:adenosylcobinamide kinase/adenosylcobinamide-phosphate guanylyltransferase